MIAAHRLLASPPASEPVGRLLRCCLLATGFAIFAALCIAMPRSGHIAPMWVANAFALTALLRSDHRRWPEIVLSCFAGNLAASLLSGLSVSAALALGFSNVVEYTLTAVILRALLGREISIEQARHLLVLGFVGAISSQLSAALQSGLLALLMGYKAAPNFRIWAIGHPLGLLLATPCFLAMSHVRTHLREQPFTKAGAISLVGLTATAVAVFAQSRYPLLFLIFPVLIFVCMNLGVFGAALGVVITSVLAVTGTVLHHGPMMLIHGDLMERTAVLQLFLGTALFSSLPVASLQARRRRAAEELAVEAARARLAEAAAAQSEAHYRQMTEGASDALGTMNMDGRLTYVSPAIEAITGHPAQDLIGRRLSEYVERDDLARIRANLEAIVAYRRPPGVPIEYRFRHKAGHWIWLQANPKVIRDDQDAPLGTVDVVRDITARKLMEAELEQARADAEAAAIVKAEFLANMSHELRTPLTAIIGFGALMAEDRGLSPRTRTHLARVRTASDALLSTVNDVLDFSKLEAGQVEICRWPTDPAELVGEVLSLLGEQAAAKGLTLEAEGLESLPERLELDRDRIRQVLVNLVGNAVKFTSRGGVRLLVGYDQHALSVRGRRHRPRHSARAPLAALPEVLAGGRVEHAPPRRHRLGPGHLQRAGRGHGRADQGGERGRARIDVLLPGASSPRD